MFPAAVTNMTSAQSLREFIERRLAAAAAEIFGAFEETLCRYEQEIDRQRRLQETSREPEGRLQESEESKLHVVKVEVLLPDEQFCKRERSSSLDPDGPEPSNVEPKEEEHCSSGEGVELRLHEETKILTDEETTDNSESESRWTLHHSVSGDGAPTSEQRCDGDASKKCVSCDLCGKAFRSRYLMKKHERIHTGEKPFVCNTCGKNFRQPYTLTVHMRSHTGVKPYACEMCGKAFSQSQAVKAHMRIHTGEKPYLCKVCGKRFTGLSAFRGHQTTHTDEKRYSCDTCGKKYKRNRALVNHIKVHKGKKFNM